MNTRTLNELIELSVLGGAEEAEAPTSTEAPKAPAQTKTASEIYDVDALAQSLEFLASTGLDDVITKTASAMATNTSMKNMGMQADTGSMERGTHHPALASNESAISYDKKEKTKRTSKPLKALLAAKPYADATLKQNLTNASGKGDKNINKQAHDLEAIRAELIRRGIVEDDN